ncbi:MBL fold metallo-hydrolase [Vallitalea maricola]|uniref:BcII family subclass B1 metallo-beta-lactamase n=1 Tax=Vallitalea maricola TaxID=3074433 RepID=A0ACB5UFR5_9FIRM|nr:BcII family subclass B1 metallo-beta-lactamase [Vallitalea sp. AN17-2]
MKKFFVLVMMIVIMVTAGCSAKKDDYIYKLDIDDEVNIDDSLTIKEIKKGVLVVNHKFPWDGNSMIIEMKNGDVALIDTPYENEATRKIIEWVRERAGQEVKFIEINTGFHFDNLGGNKYLAEQDIKIIGTSKTVNMVKERGEDARKLFLDWLKDPELKKYYDVYTKLEYIEPTEIVNIDIDEEMEIVFGDEKLVLYYPQESHSPDNIVVYYPSKKVLFGGCMVKSAESENLGNTADANIMGWSESIKKLKRKYSEKSVDVIVPGHGEVGDYSLLENTENLLEQ